MRYLRIQRQFFRCSGRAPEVEEGSANIVCNMVVYLKISGMSHGFQIRGSNFQIPFLGDLGTEPDSGADAAYHFLSG